MPGPIAIGLKSLSLLFDNADTIRLIHHKVKVLVSQRSPVVIASSS